MPRKGYKSITVRQDVYDYFFNEYSKVKEEYAIKKGVRSFSAYVSYRFTQLLELTSSKNLPRFEHFNMGSTGVKITDRKLHKIAEIYFKPEGIWCEHDQSSECDHIDFALTVPEIQDIIRKRRKEGWKLPDV
jgi:hypothetical protein